MRAQYPCNDCQSMADCHSVGECLKPIIDQVRDRHTQEDEERRHRRAAIQAILLH